MTRLMRSHSAYWTPAANANGAGVNALEAFSVVAVDDSGALSIAPRTVTVDVAGDHADAAQITAVNLPANGTYSTGQTMEFSVVFDRAVTVNTSNGILAASASIRAVAPSPSYLRGSGSTTLVFGYSVRAGDRDRNGISLGAAISPNWLVRSAASMMTTPSPACSPCRALAPPLACWWMASMMPPAFLPPPSAAPTPNGTPA
jgi:hypothetical protein